MEVNVLEPKWLRMNHPIECIPWPIGGVRNPRGRRTVLILCAHHQLEHWRTSIGPQVVAIAHLAGLAEENVVNVLQPPFNWYAVGRILSLLRGGAAAAVHGEVLFK